MSEELKMAEQQLTGYSHAMRGYSVESLAEEMGLTKGEYLLLRDMPFLTEKIISELDEHFNVTPPTQKEEG